MLEDKVDMHVTVVDKYHDPNATYVMSVRDYILRVVVTANIGIVLPRVAEAKGRFYSIVARAVTPPFTATIIDRGDSECWVGSIILNTKCDRVLLYSDGMIWTVMSSIGGVIPTAAPVTTARGGTTAPPTTTVQSTVAPTTGIV